MSSVPASHPTPDRLAAYRAGRLSQAEANEVARHVGACRSCREQLQETTMGSAATPSATLAGPSTKTTSASDELTGVFGRYRIVKRLGRGGMGSVYLAHDTQLDRSVALKVPHFAGKDKDRALERFYREARAAATLSHTNLCPVFDVGEIAGTHYLTMAYIEGRPLSDFIEPGKPLPEKQAAAVVRKLALALQEAHSHGVIHRDLKPANVMINKKKEPVLMDFGLARQANKTDVRLTQVGSIMGTPAYMPPEQVQGDVDAIGAGCDIYSLGVILYELLTGRLPFEGPVAAVLGQIMVTEPPPPSSHRPGLDPRLDAICQKAMAKKLADRYPSMAAFAAALSEFLRGEGSPTLRPSAGGKAPAGEAGEALFADLAASRDTAPVLARGTQKMTKLAAGGRRGPWLVAAAVAGVVVIAAGVLAFMLFSSKKAPDDKSQARGNPGTQPSPVRPTATQREDNPAATQPESPSKSPEVTQPTPAPATTPAAEPSEAAPAPTPLAGQGWVELFNGRDLTGWGHRYRPTTTWRVEDGSLVVTPGAGDLMTRQTFGPDFELHVEFVVPLEPDKIGQDQGPWPGNSGVYLLGRYEVQILDNAGRKGKYKPEQACGALCEVIAPSRDASKPPGEWQSFDITFRAPRVGSGNQLIAPGKVTVVHNGVTVIDQGTFQRATTRGLDMNLVEKGPILLQEFGSPVRFRRVAIRPLNDGPPAVAPTAPSLPAGQGWVELFNGRDQSGWVSRNGAAPQWQVQDGSLVVAPGAGDIMTREKYGPDFELHAEFLVPFESNRMGQGRGNSGIYLQGRHEIQILDNKDIPIRPVQACGALYDLISPSQDASKPPGQWQTFDISFHAPRMKGNQVVTKGRVTVVHNGVKVIDEGQFDRAIGGPVDTNLGQPGPILLQEHGSPVRFRRIAIRPLNDEPPVPAAASGFKDLFNGKNLMGWKYFPGEAGDWQVVNGVLVGSGRRCHLFSNRDDYENFHLRAEAMVNNPGNSGVYFRAQFGPGFPKGYEAQIEHGTDQQKTGSLYNFAPYKLDAIKPNEWFTLDVFAEGNRITIQVNGKTTASYLDPQRTYTKGHFALQMNRPGTVVKFRKIQVEELPASK